MTSIYCAYPTGCVTYAVIMLLQLLFSWTPSVVFLTSGFHCPLHIPDAHRITRPWWSSCPVATLVIGRNHLRACISYQHDEASICNLQEVKWPIMSHTVSSTNNAMTDSDMPKALSHLDFLGYSRATCPLARIIRHAVTLIFQSYAWSRRITSCCPDVRYRRTTQARTVPLVPLLRCQEYPQMHPPIANIFIMLLQIPFAFIWLPGNALGEAS